MCEYLPAGTFCTIEEPQNRQEWEFGTSEHYRNCSCCGSDTGVFSFLSFFLVFVAGGTNGGGDSDSITFFLSSPSVFWHLHYGVGIASTYMTELCDDKQQIGGKLPGTTIFKWIKNNTHTKVYIYIYFFFFIEERNRMIISNSRWKWATDRETIIQSLSYACAFNRRIWVIAVLNQSKKRCFKGTG